MWKLKRPVAYAAVVLLAGAGGLGGCAYYSPTPVVAAGTQTTQRVYTYTNGRYELRGDGTVGNPYYWVWIPTGVQSATNPPPPPIPTRDTLITAAPPDQRVYTYPNGRYELHGEGTADNPYYWVWIPASVSVVVPPPPPVPQS